MFCPKCGNNISEGMKFCSSCGASLADVIPAAPQATVASQNNDGYAGVSSWEKPAEKPSAAPETAQEPAWTPPENTFFHSEPSNSGKEKKKKPVWIFILIAAALLAVLAATLIPKILEGQKQKKYEQGIALMDSGDYDAAIEIFTGLGEYEDAPAKVEYCEIEKEYLTLPEYAERGDYAGAAALLRNRSLYYAGTPEGEKAEALAEEYDTLDAAFTSYEAGDYQSAYDAFCSLDTLKPDYAGNLCLSAAHLAEEAQDWSDVLIYLYAAQVGDPDIDFIGNPTRESDNVFCDNIDDYGDLIDADAVAAELAPESEDEQQLLDTALLGFRYDAAREALDAGEYAQAMELFEALGDFQDSPSLLQQARKGYEEQLALDYEQAKSYYESGAYDKAMELFGSLGDYEDSADWYTKAEEGYDSLVQDYENARSLLESGEYGQAMEAFEKLGDFLDSADYYAQAKEKYESLTLVYEQAMSYYKSGSYYKAKKLFKSISGYKDAADMANACVQTMPSNGSMKYGNGTALSLTVVAPSGSNYVLLRVYNTSGSVVGQVFLAPGKSATLNLNGGTYTMKTAYGTEWYGTTDLFGEGGSYSQLMNGNSTSFTLESGYEYTLTLLASTSGNVGSRSIGGAGSM